MTINANNHPVVIRVFSGLGQGKCKIEQRKGEGEGSAWRRWRWCRKASTILHGEVRKGRINKVILEQTQGTKGVGCANIRGMNIEARENSKCKDSGVVWGVCDEPKRGSE